VTEAGSREAYCWYGERHFSEAQRRNAPILRVPLLPRLQSTHELFENIARLADAGIHENGLCVLRRADGLDGVEVLREREERHHIHRALARRFADDVERFFEPVRNCPEKERKRLQGEGIALEREAIANGLKESFDIIGKATGKSTMDVMALLTLTQYLDTIKTIGTSENAKTIFMDSGVGKTGDILKQLVSALEAGK
jgi:hypothetical protein